ncbi:TetR/AcrR family transcriptional regulator [Streptomyces sp. NPDC059477]|uniref:TetR/AcrR family transcriptional regulator n=1 Tax=Streptomyces sp. NPDC059477 TaxID=3346847 RepID=UPI00367D27C4
MSSTTPAQNRPVSPRSLTERRKAATRTEIARAAARLFVSRGLKATRAEDIAQAAGIAPRTFYRYFATKEEAVAPLYAAGAQRWAAAVRDAPPHLSVPEALEHAVLHTLTPGAGVSAASWEWVRTLVRLADTSPSLGRVWAEVCRRSEVELAEVLAGRSGCAGRAGVEMDAGPGPGPGVGAEPGSATSVGAAMDSAPGSDAGTDPTSTAAAGTSDGTSAGTSAGTDNVADPMVPPALRFAAAVASAAVRVAMESWATGDGPPGGTQGPAALAVRNLRALRGFRWEG